MGLKIFNWFSRGKKEKYSPFEAKIREQLSDVPGLTEDDLIRAVQNAAVKINAENLDAEPVKVAEPVKEVRHESPYMKNIRSQLHVMGMTDDEIDAEVQKVSDRKKTGKETMADFVSSRVNKYK